MAGTPLRCPSTTHQLYVLGATGYLGEAICRAARAGGYVVTAFLRNEDYGTKRHYALALEDVNVSVYDGNLGEINIGALIDRAGGPDKCFFVDAIGAEAASRTFSEAVHSAHPEARLVAISTLLVYAEKTGAPISESDPTDTNAYEWRATLDTQISEAKGVVVRPAWAFGRSGGRYSWLQFRDDLAVICRGSPDKRHSWVHVDDLAAAVVACCDSWERCAGRIFNVSDDSVFPSRRETVCALADAVGAERPAVEWVPVDKKVDKGLSREERDLQASDQELMLNADQIRKATGWVPKRPHFIYETMTYLAAYIAHVRLYSQ